MEQLNTTSNEQSFSNLSYPENSLQTDPIEMLGLPKQISKPNNPFVLKENKSMGLPKVKGLAEIFDQKEDSKKLNMKGTLSEAFKMASLHPTGQNYLSSKSLKQKNGVLKPLNTSVTEEEDRSMTEAFDSGKIIFNPFHRDSKSPPKGDSQFLRKNIAFSSPKESLQEKLRQTSIIYRNHSAVEQLRRNRAGANYSSAKLDMYFHYPAQRNGFPSMQSHKASWDASNHPPTLNLYETPPKIKDSLREQSFSSSQNPNKTMFQHYRTRRNSTDKKDSFALPDMHFPKKPEQKTKSLSFTAVNRSLSTASLSNAKEMQSDSKLSTPIEKTQTPVGRAVSKSSNLEIHLYEPSQTDHIESKLESVLSNKSGDPQRIVEINGLFDSFIEAIRDFGNNTAESQKIRSLLRKIKLAYEVFFQVYSHHQSIKLAQAQDYQRKLEKECESLDTKIDEMELEIENLRKENEKISLQNVLLKNTAASMSYSFSTLNQQQISELGESHPESKNENAQLSEIETLKLVIAEQQNAIISMKKKEVKLVKLLYACKQRGLDIEQIYYEDVKNNGYTSHMSEGEDDIDEEAKHNTSNHQEDSDSQGNKYSDKGKGHNDSDSDESYPEYADADDNAEAQIQKKSNPNIDQNLQSKLKLDFSKLSQPYKKQTKEVVQPIQMPSPENKSKSPIKSKQQTSVLDFEDEKKGSEEQKSVGFHQEFMSKMNEFSSSWRQAAMNERKIP